MTGTPAIIVNAGSYKSYFAVPASLPCIPGIVCTHDWPSLCFYEHLYRNVYTFDPMML